MRLLLVALLISTLTACQVIQPTENICDHVAKPEVRAYCHVGQEVNNVLSAANRAFKAGEMSKNDHARVLNMVKKAHPILKDAEALLNFGQDADSQLAAVKLLLLQVK